MSLNTCIYLETITTIKAINIYHLQKFPWPPPNIFFFCGKNTSHGACPFTHFSRAQHCIVNDRSYVIQISRTY